MFFFGILSTHLPYIVLGILYLLTFSLYTVHAYSKTADEENLTEHHITIEETDPAAQSTAFQYGDYFQTQHAAALPTLNEHAFRDDEINLYPLLAPDLTEVASVFATYCRPPPMV
jgi:hypothetical protein